MFIAVVTWWYGAGWGREVTLLGERLARQYDYFSFDLLLKTLFSPFRQISAGRVNGPIGVQFQAFIDRFISRMIGAMIRVTVIIVGVIAVIFSVIFGMVRLLIWPLIPLLPIFGLILALIGWMPW